MILCAIVCSSIIACTSPSVDPKDKIETLQHLVDSLEKIKNKNPSDDVSADLLQNQQMLAETYVDYARLYRDSSDHTKPSEYLFLAARLYQYDLRDLDRAISVCDSIMHWFPETERAIDALFTQGFIYHNTLKDTTIARKLYTSFLDKYPDHDFAQYAKEELKYLGVPPEQILEEKRRLDSLAKVKRVEN